MPQTSFITKAKAKTDGSFWPCKKCGKAPVAGQDIFMQNIGDDTNKNWIACFDLECFKSQGGSEPVKKEGRKTMSPEELFDYRKKLIDLSFEYAKKVAEKEIALPTSQGAMTPEQFAQNYKEAVRERRIMASVIFYGLVAK